jgi:hypothetical protein
MKFDCMSPFGAVVMLVKIPTLPVATRTLGIAGSCMHCMPDHFASLGKNTAKNDS